MKKIKIIWVWILLLALLVTPITSIEKPATYTRMEYGADWYSFDPRIADWYAIEDWELDVCRKYGGTKMPYDEDNGPTYLSQITVTLQGQKTENPDETTMYEVAYYIENVLDKSLEYAVRLKTKEGKFKRIVAPTYLGKKKAESGYKTQYLTEEYYQVQLGYAIEGSKEITLIKVPVVDNTGEYYQSSDYGYGGVDGGDEDIWGDDW